jgi:hypothetical protein
VQRKFLSNLVRVAACSDWGSSSSSSAVLICELWDVTLTRTRTASFQVSACSSFTDRWHCVIKLCWWSNVINIQQINQANWWISRASFSGFHNSCFLPCQLVLYWLPVFCMLVRVLITIITLLPGYDALRSQNSKSVHKARPRFHNPCDL